MNKNGPIYVAGHAGLVGSAIVRRLQGDGRTDILMRTREELDLGDQRAVHEFIRREAPRCIFVAAARVGGILANSRRQADFLYENLAIAANLIHAAAEHGVEKLLFLGSSCVFPREAPQPITEESLLTGPLEPTNEGYAIAKIAGLKLCEYYAKQYGKRFIAAMPTNVYGPRDNFHPVDSHVVAGMMRRFHEAVAAGVDEVTVWGSGRPRREFLYADDLAEALVLLMDVYEETRFINIGTGEDCTISELARTIAEVAGFEGQIVFDTSKPDGMLRKLLDVSRIQALGWHARTPLSEGLRSTYEWAVANRIFESSPR
jgi:GDP-L-fucose synthase